MSDQLNPAENDLPQTPPAQASDNSKPQDHLDDETTRNEEREQHTASNSDKTPATPRTRKGRGTRPARREQPEASAESILRLPVHSAELSGESSESDETIAVSELEAQGFTTDEAIRLIHVSGRVATSREAREAEATLRRLRFTRWLIERGVLDEFSA